MLDFLFKQQAVSKKLTNRFFHFIIAFILLSIGILANAQVQADECVDDLSARAKRGKVQLAWTPVEATEKYMTLRATSMTGAFTEIGESLPPSSIFLDNTVQNNLTYYYLIQRIPSDGSATCQSAIVAAIAPAGRIRITVVPSLAGNTQSVAETALAAANLQVGNITDAPHDTISSGQVITQDPPANSSVPKNTPINFVLSNGQVVVNNPPTITSTAPTIGTDNQLYSYDADAADPDATNILVFNLDIAPSGMSIDTASGQIQWTPTVVQIGDNTVTVRVTDQGGLFDTQNFTITVEAALIPVPDVVSKSQIDAETSIIASGLTVGTITTANSDAIPAGNVISQNPLAGVNVGKNSTVSLLVSTGPQDEDNDGVNDAIDQCPDTVAEAQVDTDGCSIDQLNVTAYLALSANVIPSQQAGGSIDASCEIVDENGQATGFPILLSTNSPSAIVTGGTNFAFPDTGEFTVSCSSTDDASVTDNDTVVVVDDAINPQYSTLDVSLTKLESLHDDILIADEIDDLPALQTAKNALLTEIGNVDLAALIAAPPVPTGADVPTEAELLAAGDTQNPVIDDQFKDTIALVKQNLEDYALLLGSVTTENVTQADIDAMNDLTSAGDALITQLNTLNPSSMAVLEMNTQLNEIVSNLLPNQAINVAQYTVDVIDTAPGIVRLWQIDPLKPENMLALISYDTTNPGDMYASSGKAFSFIGLMTSQSIANSLRTKYIKKVYKPIMKHIAKMMNFLRTQDLGPFGVNPPTLNFVFGPGSSSIREGGSIQVWGENFDPVLGNNTITVSSPNGVFTVTPNSTSSDILEGSLPSGMGNHPFGLPDVGVVRVITPGGTSNGIRVNIFR